MIIQQVKTTIAGIVLAVSVVISGLVVWGFTSQSYRADIVQIKKDYLSQLVEYERTIGAIRSKAQEDTASAMKRMKDAQDSLAVLDQQKSKELANAQAENSALKRDVADGSRRVRILQANLAGCSSSHSSSGGDPSTGSMGDGAAVELTSSAADTVLSIREGIISDQAKVNYLQLYIKDVVKQCKRM